MPNDYYLQISDVLTSGTKLNGYT